jgi:hypothetical protein
MHEGAERRIILVKVHVRIYRREGGKAREIAVRPGLASD